MSDIDSKTFVLAGIVMKRLSSNPDRYILIGPPAPLDRFLEEGGHELQPDEVVGPPTPDEIERLREASPRFGVTLLSDWPPPK